MGCMILVRTKAGCLLESVLIQLSSLLIQFSNTSTRKGLKVSAVLDENEYEAGREISEIELAGLNLQRDNFHPEWNYTIIPRGQSYVESC